MLFRSCVNISSHVIENNLFIFVTGHGFKLAPAVGKILVDLVDGIEPTLLTAELRAERFQ